MKSSFLRTNLLLLTSFLFFSDKLFPGESQVLRKEIAILKGHEKPITKLEFSKDLSYLATGAEDNRIILWELKSLQPRKTFSGHSDFISSLSFSNDNRYLLSGSKDKTAILWDLSKGEPVCKISSFKDLVNQTSFSKDSKLFAISVFYENSIHIYKTSDCKEVKVINQNGIVSGLDFSNEENTIVSASGDTYEKDLYIWSFPDQKLLGNFGNHGDGVRFIFVSKKYIGSGSRNSPLTLWDKASGKLSASFTDSNEKLNQTVDSIAINSSEDHIAATFDFSCNLGIWNIRGKKKIAVIPSNFETCFSTLRFKTPKSVLAALSPGTEIHLIEVTIP
ncbi:hypothetical protein CH373_06575 [Leptospira perolatii]|uniref:Uncharacterized protein n=1 Tax=Leptospira perolatii TaxID=2023191 RepID=A0A2M9ZP09_9LEPT|nr:WD40 repeat domain-containing protein [Leptospira perolatii]PJZ70606.1 hypothetical protein CH360_03435 [Leptospira perolatii]PJZ73818.1 hypothetical protein CH373_06575 [Leptospira perolatii]